MNCDHVTYMKTKRGITHRKLLRGLLMTTFIMHEQIGNIHVHNITVSYEHTLLGIRHTRVNSSVKPEE